MTRAHGIDVETFHDLDILQHALQGHHITTIGIHLVAVGTLDEHRLAVDEQLLVFDLHLAEAHLLWNDLHDVTLAVLHRGDERIEIRCLCRPLLHVAHHEAGCSLGATVEVGR